MSFQPKSFEILEISITPVNGNAIDVRYLMSDVNIYEDLFGNGITATMTLVDSTNQIQNLPIFGFEIVKISFRTPGKEDFTHTFRLYKIENRSLTKESQQVYTLQMISAENFTNRMTRVSKSYKGKLISDIVNDIQVGYLNSSFKNLEPTKFLHHVVIPNINPMEAIRWLSTRANAANWGGSNYVYYENKKGYNFVPIDMLVRQPFSVSYHVHPASMGMQFDGNVMYDQPNFDEIQIGVENYTFKNHIDTLESLMAGMYGSKLITHNIIRKRFFEQDFSYTKSYPTFNHLEENTGFNEIFKFTGATFLSDQAQSLDTPNAVLRVFPSGQKSEDYPNQVEEWAQERISRLQQIHTICLSISVPGDSERVVGEVVEFVFPSPEAISSKTQQLELYHRGNYMITGIHHMINHTEYISYIEMVKDSFFEPPG